MQGKRIVTNICIGCYEGVWNKAGFTENQMAQIMLDKSMKIMTFLSPIKDFP